MSSNMAYEAFISGDYATALQELRPLAEQGDAVAQIALGAMYAKGNGVPLDDYEAVKLLRLAAEQGDAEAQTYLGVMYANGTGVPQDDKEAVKWYRLAAEQGHAKAQNNLGVIYAKRTQNYKDCFAPRVALSMCRYAVTRGTFPLTSQFWQVHFTANAI